MEKNDQFCFGYGMIDKLILYLSGDNSVYWFEIQKSFEKIFGVISRMLMLMEIMKVNIIVYRDYIKGDYRMKIKRN